jgi:hypothetical protein
MRLAVPDLISNSYLPAVAELIRRDLPYYDPAISAPQVTSLNGFAQDIGWLAGPVPYEQVVATRFQHLWNL